MKANRKEKNAKHEVSLGFGIALMIIVTILVAFLTYQYATSKIALDYKPDEGVGFLIDNPTILEIIALVIIVIAISYWIRMYYKKKNKK